ncbi:TRAP transporter substrate-binding protein [uncultured Roseibium sp.]|uniref:TRAP transporter substrate-binding protein n=1 Tax=uncultured Roseibium sp. TaxID=1936171 RepID=UPI0032176063
MFRNVIRNAALAATLLAGVAGATGANAEQLTVGSFLPGPHHLHTRVLSWFAEELEKQSGGSLTVQVFPGGQLGSGPVQQYKRALEGVADMTLGVSAYTPTVFPKTMLAILPGSSKTAVESTARVWDAHDEYLADEYKDVKLIGLFTVAGNVISSTRDMSTLDAWEGAKLVPYASMTQPILEALDAVPVQMPITDVYTGLSTGTIDAAYTAYSNITPPWNFWDVSPYFVENVPVHFAVLFVVMNKERYEGLSSEHKALIDTLAGRPFSMRAAESFDEADTRARAEMAANPGKMSESKMVQVSDGELARMNERSEAGLKAIFAQYQDNGIDDAEEIYKALNP